MEEDNSKEPLFDYIGWPYQNRRGFHAVGNNKWRTASLFLEKAKGHKAQKEALYCLKDYEVFAEGQWYPSAWMIYIHAEDEYDAAMKIVGNLRQWEALKNTTWFPEHLADWQAEAAHIQRMKVKRALLSGVENGSAGYTTAAKQLLQMIDGKGTVGRPKKAKEKVDSSDELQDDIERMSKLFAS